MKKPLSVYLDLVRFLAAMVVLLGHLSGKRFTGGLFWPVAPLMDEAVTVFFVISGFVISYVVYERREGRDAYIAARASRILSVAIPALLTTALCDSLGRSLHPEYYAEGWGFSGEQTWLQYGGALLFLNRIWYAEANVGSNLPYWSLCYEVWYYVAFGFMVFGRGKTRFFGVLGTLAICGPTIASMLPVWLFGVLAHRCCMAGRLGPKAGTVLCLSTAAGIALYLGFGSEADSGLLRFPAFFNRDETPHDYIIGALFAAHLVGASAASGVLSRVIMPLSRPVRWLAGATFSIYLFHLPVAQFLTTVVAWPPNHVMTRAVVVVGTLVIVFAAAQVTERRKDLWKPLVARLLSSEPGGASAREARAS
jgi:peptidoglycan/LPS O-acetylase OafA/YrhL